MKQKKKMAAALAAVTAYIKSDQEAQMAMAAQAAEAPAKAMPEMNIWGLSGRQAQMQMRSLVQVKAFHGAKLR